MFMKLHQHYGRGFGKEKQNAIRVEKRRNESVVATCWTIAHGQIPTDLAAMGGSLLTLSQER